MSFMEAWGGINYIFYTIKYEFFNVIFYNQIPGSGCGYTALVKTLLLILYSETDFPVSWYVLFVNMFNIHF
jgi:hypothetical protein